LELWIEAKRYLNTETSIKEIASEMGMSVDQMHLYFRDVVGEEFRTWRVRKRVEHAQQLMQEHPDWPVTRIAQISGFNDRSWFYQQFLRFTGMTVAECRKK
jgi:AraC-like DNA-binding protein